MLFGMSMKHHGNKFYYINRKSYHTITSKYSIKLVWASDRFIKARDDKIRYLHSIPNAIKNSTRFFISNIFISSTMLKLSKS